MTKSSRSWRKENNPNSTYRIIIVEGERRRVVISVIMLLIGKETTREVHIMIGNVGQGVHLCSRQSMRIIIQCSQQCTSLFTSIIFLIKGCIHTCLHDVPHTTRMHQLLEYLQRGKVVGVVEMRLVRVDAPALWSPRGSSDRDDNRCGSDGGGRNEINEGCYRKECSLIT